MSPSNYEARLAACYDVLKGINGNNTVIAFGVSPRAQNAQSMTPADFIKGVGAAYKASGRTKPIMDQVGIHPYPNQNARPAPAPDKAGYSVAGDIGIPQMDVLKQAIYDGFNGTGQPTTLGGLMIVVDEVGYQTVTDGVAGYTGSEISPTVSEADQASYYARIVQIYACGPSIAQVLFFHLVDEADRGAVGSRVSSTSTARRSRRRRQSRLPSRPAVQEHRPHGLRRGQARRPLRRSTS